MKTNINLLSKFKRTAGRLSRLVSNRPNVRKRRRDRGYERHFALFRFVLSRSFVCAAVFLIASPARSTTIGLSTDSMGGAWSRLDSNSGFAVWDTFSSTSFSNDAPGSSFGISDPALSQSSVFTNFAQGAGLYQVATSTPSTTPANNDVLFPGGNSVDFLLSGEVNFTIHGLTLQIKRPSSNATLADANGFAPTLSIDGGAPLAADLISTAFGSGDTSSTNGLWSVTTWSWGASLASLPDTGSDSFALTISKTGSQRLLDGFAVDVGPQTVVPEPSSCFLVVCGAGAMLLRRRNKRNPFCLPARKESFAAA